MKNYKGNMLLIELVIVILFFSLSQVVLVQVFAGAQRKAINCERLNSALLEMQDLAERLSRRPDPEAVLSQAGFTAGDGVYTLHTDIGIDYSAELSRLSQQSGQLIRVQLTARQAEKELFTLPAIHYVEAGVQP